MNYTTIKKIIEDNPNIVDFGEFGQGVSDEWLERAQSRLCIEFPPSYIWWLKNYGGGEINGEEIFSIYEIDFDTVVGGDVVYINELNQKNNSSTPQQLVIQENDQGESYYFNLNEMDENGEYPVYIDIQQKKYADDFFHFIEKKVTE